MSHITKHISNQVLIISSAEKVWEHITNVRLEAFADPILFRMLDIPKPMKAELISSGEGGSRIAYFENGKRFIQRITVWRPFEEYAFSFNPEKGFRVGYVFDLVDGVFRILNGAYHLTPSHPAPGAVSLELRTEYSLDKRLRLILALPIAITLNVFQQYLLRSIKRNAEAL